MNVFSRQLGVILLCAFVGWPAAAAAQQTKKRPPARKPSATAAKPKPQPPAALSPADQADEKTRFDAAIAAATPAEKAELLIKFISDFPKSANRQRAQESLSVARAALADESLTAGNADRAAKLFRLAVDEAPKPYSDRLFAEIIAMIPVNLYWRGNRTEAYEIARAIESNIGADAKRLAALANFYLSVEDGTEAKRVAEAAIQIDGGSAAGYQALGMAMRLNFDLDQAEKAFAKALELDPDSAQSKRMLAEMKRALGKPDEATALYQELLAKDENDIPARTGYVLALFDGGKRSEAEAELSKALEKTPGNVYLLSGAAYWYAANNEGAKAVDLAQKAIAKEPRLIWSHIALARGQMALGKPIEAEQALISARKFGNFPTLQYEIASARFAAGLFREAAEELRKSFTAGADGIHSRLGGRIDRTEKTFTELVSFERRASIFTPASGDSAETSEQLRALLEFDQLLNTESPDEGALIAAAERFTAGSDAMATHRKLYAARSMNEKQIAGQKALEYAQSAIAKVDTALDVASPGSAVMAAELYDARATAFSNNDYLLIPEVPKPTLSSILRGRIEESAGLALLQTGNAAEAEIRFRRALSVFPRDSAWWRSATWNLGRALEATGKDDEALRAYISSYRIDKPSVARYVKINALYRKVKGDEAGLDAEIGPNPLANTITSTQPVPAPEGTPTAEPPSAVRTADAPFAAPTAAKPLPRNLPVDDSAMKPVEPVRNSVRTEIEAETPVGTKSAEGRATEETNKAAGEKVVEAKTQPVEIPKADPSTDAKPTEEVKPPTPEPTPEMKADEVRKDPPAELPIADTPKTVPDQPKTEEKKPEPHETPSDLPGALKASETPVTEPKPEVTPDDIPKQKREENKDTEQNPTPSDQLPVAAKPPLAERKRFAVVKTDLTDATALKPLTKSSQVKETPRDPSRPLFEPVVIQIPSAGKAKPVHADETASKRRNSSDEQREEVQSNESVKPCTVGVSQENIAIAGEDGTVALLVSVDEGIDISTVKGVSNTDEIQVTREPRIAGIDDRIVYVLRSVSGKAGMYQVFFSAPCGSKTVNVRVR